MARPPISRLLSFLMLVTALAAPAWTSQPASAAPLDRFWPMARHDVRRTNHSPGQGEVVQPAVRWRYPLGGLPAGVRGLDLDRDGEEDLLIVEGGRVAARTMTGQVLWVTAPLGILGLPQVVDLDGDGQSEVVAASSTTAYVLNSVTGKTVWTSPAGLFPLLGLVYPSDFDGDGVADLAVADGSGAAGKGTPGVRIYGFVGGGHQIAQTAVPLSDGTFGSNIGLLIVDVDGDGLPDLLPQHVGRVAAFSGKTGQLLGISPPLPQLAPLSMNARSVPVPGAKPYVVLTSDFAGTGPSMRGYHVLQLEGTVLQLRHSNLATDLAAERYQTLNSAIGQLDGAEGLEVLSSRYVEGAWRLEAHDLATGATLTTLTGNDPMFQGKGGPRIHRVLRLGLGGPVVLAVLLATTVDEPPFPAQRLLTWTRAEGFKQWADLGPGKLASANWQASDNGSSAVPSVPVALPLSANAPPLTELVLTRDTDADLNGDRVEVLRLSPGGQTAVLHQADFPLPPAVLASLAGKAGRRLVVGLPDGQGHVLGPDLKLVNDADGNGAPDLRFSTTANPHVVVMPVQDNDATPMVLVGQGGRLTALDPTDAGALNQPKVRWVFKSGPAGVLGALVDLTGDGKREVVVRHVPVLGAPTVTALDSDGKPLWSHVQPGGPWGIPSLLDGDKVAWADLDGDKADDLIIGYFSLGKMQPGMQAVFALRGKDGQPLWGSDVLCGMLVDLPWALDTVSQPPRLVYSGYYERFVCDATTGKLLLQRSKLLGSYGVPMLEDLNADGALDLVLAGPATSREADLAPEFNPAWAQPDLTIYHGRAAMLPVDGQPAVAQLAIGEPRLYLYDAKTGQTKWTRILQGGKAFAPEVAPTATGSLGGLVSVADLTGTGHPSLLLHSSEGYLYSLDARTGEVEWSMNWGGTLGDPVVADVDGDSKVEILVAAADGWLYALDAAQVQPPAWAYENDGTGPALTAGADIDQQSSTTTLHANWAAVPGAVGYTIQLEDITGAIIVPQQNVPAGTSFTFQDLHLQPGQTYRVAVMARASGPTGETLSAPVRSDGVLIVDDTPPTVEGLIADPPVIKSGGTTVLKAHLRDKTRLARWDVRIGAAAGPPVWNQKALVATTKIDLVLPWQARDNQGQIVPPGIWVALLRTRDTQGHEAVAATTIKVCAPGEEVVGLACRKPGIGGPDGQGKAGDVKALNGSVHEGCIAGKGSGKVPVALVGPGLVWVAMRRRRRPDLP